MPNCCPTSLSPTKNCKIYSKSLTARKFAREICKRKMKEILQKNSELEAKLLQADVDEGQSLLRVGGKGFENFDFWILILSNFGRIKIKFLGSRLRTLQIHLQNANNILEQNEQANENKRKNGNR